MEKFFVQPITPAQAYRLFLADPYLCQSFIDVAFQLDHMTSKGRYSNVEDVIFHAELLFTLAYAFQQATDKIHYFQLIEGASKI